MDVACLEDDARFAQLYAPCHRPIWDYCARRVPTDVVDDIVADTFLTVWRRLDDVPDGEEALLWMYGVAYRMIGHQWRGTARRRQLHERLRSVRPEPAAGEPVVDGIDHRLVLAALAALGETDAEVLRLVVWEHLSVTAAATVLGMRLHGRQRLHRARGNLVREYAKLQSRPTSTPAAPRDVPADDRGRGDSAARTSRPGATDRARTERRCCWLPRRPAHRGTTVTLTDTGPTANKAFQRTAPADMSGCTTEDGGTESIFLSWDNAYGDSVGAAPGQIETLSVLDIDGTVVVINAASFAGAIGDD